MVCPHCRVSFHEGQSYESTYIRNDEDGHWFARSHLCPTCKRAIIFLVRAVGQHVKNSQYPSAVLAERLIRPLGTQRPPCPKAVVDEDSALAADYAEACLVLPDSAKASSALSRRCLQHLLRSKAKTKKRDLADQIQEVLDTCSLPSHLAENLDTVRVLGNFAAHPIKSTNTGEVVDVEDGEAEWNLDVIEGLFDFYFVQPAISKARRDALNNKLNEAGKPPLKQP